MVSPQQKSAIELVKTNSEYESYFFRRLKDWRLFDALSDAGLFKASRVPDPVETKEGMYTVPFWSPLDYFETLSKLPSSEIGSSIHLKILDVIHDVTSTLAGRHPSNFRTWWFFGKIISNLPVEVISDRDISLVDFWLDCSFDSSLLGDEIGSKLLPKLLKSEKNECSKVEILLLAVFKLVKHSSSKEKEEKYIFRINDYWMEQLIEINGVEAGKKYGKALVPIFENKVLEVLSKHSDEKESYAYIWRPAIENHHQNVHKGSLQQSIDIYRDICLGYVETNGESSRELFQKALASPSLLIQRVALHVISLNYDNLGPLFWEYLCIDRFYENNLHHELYALVSSNFSKFTSTQKNLVLKIIKELEFETKNAEKEESLTKHLRLTWLSAIKNKGLDEADTLAEEYSKNSSVSSHPDFLSYVESGWGPVTPIQSDRLLEMGAAKVKQHLTEFKESSTWRDGSYQGVQEALQTAVESNPEKMTELAENLSQVPKRYWHSIMYGFSHAWRQKRPFEWVKVIGPIPAILSDESFWKSENSTEEFAPDYFVNSVCDLIEQGTKDTKWTLPESLAGNVRQILDIIFTRQKSVSFEGVESPMSRAINAPLGKYFAAFFNFSLWRRHSLGSDEAWKEVEPQYNSFLPQQNGSCLEFSTLLGNHLSGLFYLSANWVTNNINRIFPMEFPDNWRCAMDGLCYGGVSYKPLFELILGNISEAVLNRGEQFKEIDHLYDLIAVGYLNEIEGLDEGSTLGRLVRKKDFKALKRIIWFFWRGDFKPEQIGRVMEFWKACDSILSPDSTEEKALLGKLSLLTERVQNLTGETLDLVRRAARFSDESGNSGFLVENLAKLVTPYPEAVGGIFRDCLVPFRPTYPEEKIRRIVEVIYAKGYKELGNAICNGYKSDFLKQEFDRHNPPSA